MVYRIFFKELIFAYINQCLLCNTKMFIEQAPIINIHRNHLHQTNSALVCRIWNRNNSIIYKIYMKSHILFHYRSVPTCTSELGKFVTVSIKIPFNSFKIYLNSIQFISFWECDQFISSQFPAFCNSIHQFTSIHLQV